VPSQPTIRALRETAHHSGHSRLDPRLRALRRPIRSTWPWPNPTHTPLAPAVPTLQTVARPSPTRRYKGQTPRSTRLCPVCLREKGQEILFFPFPGRRRRVAPDLGKEVRLTASRVESRGEFAVPRLLFIPCLESGNCSFG